jgi:hypothetical protein
MRYNRFACEIKIVSHLTGTWNASLPVKNQITEAGQRPKHRWRVVESANRVLSRWIAFAAIVSPVLPFERWAAIGGVALLVNDYL